MSMPHLMNCSHSGDGWCLACVREMYEEKQTLEINLGKISNKLLITDEAVEILRNSYNRQRQWIGKAKQGAGFDENTSFDVVWGEMLEVWLARYDVPST